MLLGSWMNTTGSSFFSLSKEKFSDVTLSCGAVEPGVERGLRYAERISGPQYALLTPGTGPGSM